MKTMLAIVILATSLSATVYQTTKDGEIAVQYNSDMTVNTFCRKGIQWLALTGSYRSGIAMDAEPVDPKDASKGVKPIFCKSGK